MTFELYIPRGSPLNKLSNRSLSAAKNVPKLLWKPKVITVFRRSNRGPYEEPDESSSHPRILYEHRQTTRPLGAHFVPVMHNDLERQENGIEEHEFDIAVFCNTALVMCV